MFFDAAWYVWLKLLTTKDWVLMQNFNCFFCQLHIDGNIRPSCSSVEAGGVASQCVKPPQWDILFSHLFKKKAVCLSPLTPALPIIFSLLVFNSAASFWSHCRLCVVMWNFYGAWQGPNFMILWNRQRLKQIRGIWWLQISLSKQRRDKKRALLFLKMCLWFVRVAVKESGAPKNDFCRRVSHVYLTSWRTLQMHMYIMYMCMQRDLSLRCHRRCNNNRKL